MAQSILLGLKSKDNLTGVKTLFAYSEGSGAFMSLSESVGSPYQVPAGKILYIHQIKTFQLNSASNINIGYGTEARDQQGQPAGWVNYAKYGFWGKLMEYTTHNVYLIVPASKYPVIESEAEGGVVIIIGEEL